ncbi:hypothetical protein KV557_24960 [Kitasatospora aureofaciens]|uniref:hypothetical protein n=1 Tax=Kitasatospora aureofaciens TaxID=1894 RepID=UPI001C449978|nr:hypothetical protein [Kitasatospora aureofaciens]MBV6700317.1 hypothetical protein [Kitasatospora aureofaciens]
MDERSIARGVAKGIRKAQRQRERPPLRQLKGWRLPLALILRYPKVIACLGIVLLAVLARLGRS